MNGLTYFGPVEEVANVALDAIYLAAEVLGWDDPRVRSLELGWSGIVMTPGGSHFPSWSSSPSANPGEKPPRIPDYIGQSGKPDCGVLCCECNKRFNRADPQFAPMVRINICSDCSSLAATTEVTP